MASSPSHTCFPPSPSHAFRAWKAPPSLPLWQLCTTPPPRGGSRGAEARRAAAKRACDTFQQAAGACRGSRPSPSRSAPPLQGAPSRPRVVSGGLPLAAARARGGAAGEGRGAGPRECGVSVRDCRRGGPGWVGELVMAEQLCVCVCVCVCVCARVYVCVCVCVVWVPVLSGTRVLPCFSAGGSVRRPTELNRRLPSTLRWSAELHSRALRSPYTAEHKAFVVHRSVRAVLLCIASSGSDATDSLVTRPLPSSIWCFLLLCAASCTPCRARKVRVPAVPV